MSDGDDAIALSIEDAFAQTLADMEEAREELASIPVESESPSIDSAFEVAVSEVSEEVPVPNPPMEPSPILSPVEEIPAPSMEVPPSLPMGGPPAGPPMGGPPEGPPMMGPPAGPPMMGPPAGPPMMGPPMGGPPAGPPMMGPPMGGPPAGPPMMGPPMGGPPAGPPMGAPPSPPVSAPPSPPSVEPPSIAEDHESTLQVADLSAITTDFQPTEAPSQESDSTVEFDESVVVNESVEEEQFVPPVIPEEPEFNPVDADDFMSDFQDDWDEKVPLRASDVDRTEGMDW